MEKAKMVSLLLVLALVVAAVEGARDLPKNTSSNNKNNKAEDVEHPQNVYGAVGGVGGVVPGEGGGFNPVVVTGGGSFNCPIPGIALGCTFNVRPALPGGAAPGVIGALPTP